MVQWFCFLVSLIFKKVFVEEHKSVTENKLSWYSFFAVLLIIFRRHELRCLHFWHNTWSYSIVNICNSKLKNVGFAFFLHIKRLSNNLNFEYLLLMIEANKVIHLQYIRFEHSCIFCKRNKLCHLCFLGMIGLCEII